MEADDEDFLLWKPSAVEGLPLHAKFLYGAAPLPAGRFGGNRPEFLHVNGVDLYPGGIRRGWPGPVVPYGIYSIMVYAAVGAYVRVLPDSPSFDFQSFPDLLDVFFSEENGTSPPLFRTDTCGAFRGVDMSSLPVPEAANS